ncbi:MAG: QueT transporter family protein [Oscillospiraceae bacterium]|nr:QueT transporter family protein [Oscillospiraceae bacterium]
MKSKFNVRKIAFAGVIAALYAALTMTLTFMSYGPIQFRIAEALTVLPFLFPFSIWGIFVGCIIANVLSPYPLDMIIGPIASLLAGLCTMQIGKMSRDSISIKALACFPPVIFNAVFIGAMIAFYIVGFEDTSAFVTTSIISGLQVGFGQLVILYALGLPLLIYLQKSEVYHRMKEFLSVG